MDDRTRSRGRARALADVGPELPHDDGTLDILARTRDDEDAAAEARLRYRHEPMEELEADAAIAPLLCPTERLLAVRRGAVLDRRQPQAGSRAPGLVGDLYLTSARLIYVSRITLMFALQDVEEAVLSGDRLLLVIADGTGVSLEVHRPRLLRVEIATARAGARRDEPPIGAS